MKRFTLLVSCMLALTWLALSATPVAAPASAQQTYEFTFAWNDIWGPKFRASQV